MAVFSPKRSSRAPVGDGVRGGAVGATTAIIGAGDVGVSVARMPFAGDCANAVGEAVVGSLVVGAWNVVGIGVVGHAAIWH